MKVTRFDLSGGTTDQTQQQRINTPQTYNIDFFHKYYYLSEWKTTSNIAAKIIYFFHISQG